MSFSNTSGTNDSTLLNQAAAHDTGIYDPDVHDNQIVAMYETDAQARSAYDRLITAGVAADAIQIVSRGAEQGTLGGVNAEDQNGGVWGAIRSMFVPDEDRSAYTHAVGRGHAMLLVTPRAGMDRTNLVHILEKTDPVDFDAKLEEWRQAGYDTSTAHEEYSRTMTGGVALGAASTAAATPVAAMGANDTLKVMEETLRVGKREVSAGGARIRSYVVERPIEEQVRLRQERVSIERHPVDRAATAADMAAFQERTIEARATSEEPVVSKETRVIEEIGLKKDVTERVETVHDTVRKTEVEVDDTATGAMGTAAGKANTVATPGAGTSGANTPRR